MTAPEVVHHDGAVTVAGLWTYQWAARCHPRLHPVATPAGHVLTRDAPADHPWHHGLWFTVKFVDGDNFWEEFPPHGVLRHDGPPEVEARAGGVVALRGTLRWVRPDRRTVALVEDRTLTHVPLGPDAYAVDLDTTLTPAAPCTLDRTPFTTWGGYGGLTVRGPGDWVDTVLLLPDGSTHDRVLGVPAAWCDLTGTPPGGADPAARAGLTLVDHPDNPWSPVPFYGSTRADTYGDDGWSNFLNAAFLWDGPRTVTPDAPLRVRHRTLVHDGSWTPARISAAAASAPA